MRVAVQVIRAAQPNLPSHLALLPSPRREPNPNPLGAPAPVEKRRLTLGGRGLSVAVWAAGEPGTVPALLGRRLRAGAHDAQRHTSAQRPDDLTRAFWLPSVRLHPVGGDGLNGCVPRWVPPPHDARRPDGEAIAVLCRAGGVLPLPARALLHHRRGNAHSRTITRIASSAES